MRSTDEKTEDDDGHIRRSLFESSPDTDKSMQSEILPRKQEELIDEIRNEPDSDGVHTEEAHAYALVETIELENYALDAKFNAQLEQQKVAFVVKNVKLYVDDLESILKPVMLNDGFINPYMELFDTPDSFCLDTSFVSHTESI